MDPAGKERSEPAGWAPPQTPSVDTPTAPIEPPSFDDVIRRIGRRVGFGEIDVPFDSPVEAVSWWFRPLIDARTWRCVASLLAMSVIGPLFFGLTIAVLVITATMSILVIGLVLVIPAFAAIAAFAAVGRRIAGWATGEPVSPRLTSPQSAGFLAPVTSRLTDETRWRHVGFVLLDLVMGPVFLAAGVFPLTVLSGAIGAIDIGMIGVDADAIQLLIAIPALGLVARLAQFVATLRRRYVVALIGPDRESALVERVEELSVQRDQVLEAVASERRRIERNLHDGVQQQLVALGIDIGRARNKLADDPDAARELLDDATGKVRSSIGELRLIGRGLHPAVLDDRGLDAALSAVVANAPIPIAVDVEPMNDTSGAEMPLPGHVAETAYYVANEAITNVLKYSTARVASIRVEPDAGLLPAARVIVHDDGAGGADERGGSGIAGMRARVEAVDGAFHIDSPLGGPTVVTAVIPIRRTLRDDADVTEGIPT